MTKIGSQQYFDEVLKEIDNIKKHATIEEINKLNSKLIRPNKRTGCIYGQMTGDCFSDRATELIQNCASKVVSFTGIFSYANLVSDQARNNGRYSYTFLENCISNYNKNNKNIIKYLKGEIKELNLTINNY